MRKPFKEVPKNLIVSSESAIEHILDFCPERIKVLSFCGTPGEQGARVEKLRAKAQSLGLHYDFFQAEGQERALVRAELADFPYAPLETLVKNEAKHALVIALDHLQDPQNVGAIIRSAEALGALAVILPKDRAAQVSAGVHHASAGAVETLPVVLVTNLTESLRKLKDAGYWIVGSSTGGKAKPVQEMPTFEKIVLVMGAELEGMGRLVEETCDWLVEIPLQGKVQSLNVSAAAAILIYEMSKRLGKP